MTPEVQRRLLDRLLPGWDEGQEIRGERKASCPLHDDRHPSLRIKTSELTWFCDPCGFGGGVWDLALRMHGEAGAREILESLLEG